MHALIDGWMDGWVCGCMDVWMYVCVLFCAFNVVNIYIMYNIYIHISLSVCTSTSCDRYVCFCYLLTALHWSIVTSCESPRPPLHDELQPLKTTQLVATSAVQWPLITSANDNWKAVCCTPYISWKLSSNQKRTLVHLPGLLSSHQQTVPELPATLKPLDGAVAVISAWYPHGMENGWAVEVPWCPWNHQREVSWQINKASWGVCIWRRI